ncbi:hypothetical protein KDA_65170 [Dictyobacter alpinus]|uniref:5'-3' exonuclease n=1 Tax=Dictyobacter alpinus TaxID=2014873 RepID=A0A402BI37_9CHLR|nr:5'-3' exonuclease H3TH domain-containing protein [Dictyobacter alpinus]GCE31033.1 hypothetical protein KDA_65170 [Dictyobacter alpinus]
MPPLVIVDGHNLLFRAAFGFPTPIKSRSGQDRTATFGFFAIARKAAMGIGEAEWVVFFDGAQGTATRLAEDATYKAQRVLKDPTIFDAMPDIKAGLDLLQIRWLELPTTEADDLISTLVGVEAEQGRQIYIMSMDKDFYQLVNPTTVILNTARKREQWIISHEDILAQYGVLPAQWCDFRALTGDPSDNIQGITGIGPRTAARLLADGMMLEELVDSGRLSGTIEKKVIAGWEKVLQNRHLLRMRLITDAQLANLTTGKITNWLPAQTILSQLNLWE